jgi:trans-aconitate 2-methyltransferase
VTSTQDWDARRYHQVAQPHLAWGARVVDRLELEGHETVLDAGCGSGGVTRQLLERLPRGRVIAADRSPAMLEEARSNLKPYARQVELLEVDLLEIDARLDEKVDAILSTATFHWIEDHVALFRALRNVLEPHGQLVAQCGGGANLARFAQITDAIAAEPPYAEHLSGQRLWRAYYGVDDTRARLQRAAFADIQVWLEDSPQAFATAEAFGTFCQTVVLSRHMSALPESLRLPFASRVGGAVLDHAGAYVLDYVRLNLQARAA